MYTSSWVQTAQTYMSEYRWGRGAKEAKYRGWRLNWTHLTPIPEANILSISLPRILDTINPTIPTCEYHISPRSLWSLYRNICSIPGFSDKPFPSPKHMVTLNIYSKTLTGHMTWSVYLIRIEIGKPRDLFARMLFHVWICSSVPGFIPVPYLFRTEGWYN